MAQWYSTVPEIIDAVFAKTSPKRWFSMTEYERFGLVFTQTRVYEFGHWIVMQEIVESSLLESFSISASERQLMCCQM